MTLADEVKRLRAVKGLTQKQLAASAGVSQQFVAKLETGERERFGADVLYGLCDALGVECEHFRPFLPSTAKPNPPPTDTPKANGKKK